MNDVKWEEIVKKDNLILQKTFNFSLKIIDVYRDLSQNKKEFVLSKQLLRSATSIGANCEEADGAQSKKDFIAKMSISFKEAKETRYWIRLLIATNYLSNESLLNECDEIIKIITKILITSKENLSLSK